VSKGPGEDRPLHEPRLRRGDVVGPIDATEVPRYAGFSTFARLPRSDEVDSFDVAVLGIPYDGAVTYRPGARFGPSGIRQASRLLRPYHSGLDVAPLTAQQVVDVGDVVCNPYRIPEALAVIERAAGEILGRGARLISVGGDHSIALPLLRAVARVFGPVALVHFDAHLDTWDRYFGEWYTHGTPFRRAAEEGLLLEDRSAHVGIRGPLYDRSDLTEDAELGFCVVDCMEIQERGVDAAVQRVLERVGDSPAYVSVDIDVLDPAFAPGTGTPEAGGLSSRELLALLRGLRPLRLTSADVVEVAPAYDHAEITGVAASHVVYELMALMGKTPAPARRSA
jgi:agmatinase